MRPWNNTEMGIWEQEAIATQFVGRFRRDDGSLRPVTAASARAVAPAGPALPRPHRAHRAHISFGSGSIIHLFLLQVGVLFITCTARVVNHTIKNWREWFCAILIVDEIEITFLDVADGKRRQSSTLIFHICRFFSEFQISDPKFAHWWIGGWGTCQICLRWIPTRSGWRAAVAPSVARSGIERNRWPGISQWPTPDEISLEDGSAGPIGWLLNQLHKSWLKWSWNFGARFLLLVLSVERRCSLAHSSFLFALSFSSPHSSSSSPLLLLLLLLPYLPAHLWKIYHIW